jgi:transcriptional regulator with XRE-family HTH domain
MANPAVLLRDARRRAGLTQRQLALRLGISQAAIAKLERPGANPTFATLAGALRAT